MNAIPTDIAQTILCALQVARGDDLERAERAFRGLPAARMQQQYGASGRTRQEILDDYRKRREANDLATAWVQTTPWEDRR